MARLSFAAALCLCACGGERKEPPVRDAPAATAVPAPVPDSPLGAPPAPTGPVHYDDDAPARPPRGAGTARAGRPIEILLRSSPVVARVSVDGRPLGNTPQLWQGEADGRPHEFTFQADGYALARYRFLPVTSGIVHASLEVMTDESNVVQAPPEVQRAPDPAHPLPPPVDDALAPLALPPDAPAAPVVAPAPPDACAAAPDAAPPAVAAPLVERVGELLRARGLTVETGRFGASMAVELTNDGPVTIVLSSDGWG